MNRDTLVLVLGLLVAIFAIAFGTFAVVRPDRLIRYLYSDWFPESAKEMSARQPHHVQWRLSGLILAGFGGCLLWAILRTFGSSESDKLPSQLPEIASRTEPGAGLALFGGAVMCAGILTILKPEWLLVLVPREVRHPGWRGDAPLRRIRHIGRLMGLIMCIGGLVALFGGLRGL